MSRWTDWYWNKGGREKVQYSRKVTQVLRYVENQKKTNKDNKQQFKDNKNGNS